MQGTRTRTALILAAGVGSRLRPLTDDVPKALLALHSETLLGRSVRLLLEYGVQKLVVATGYRGDQVRAALDGVGVEVDFCYNADYATTQNAASFAACAAALAGQAFFKLDGDLVFLPELLSRLDASRAELAAAVDSVRAPGAEAMKVECDPTGRILAFGKELLLSRAHGESIGIERISERAGSVLLSELARPAYRNQYYEDVYSRLIAERRVEAQAVEVGDLGWAEVDDPADLARARTLVG